MSIKATLRARKRRRRILLGSAIAAVVALLVGIYFIVASLNVSYSPLMGKQVSPSVMQELTGVDDGTLAAIKGGGSGVTPPASISGSPLSSGGKPEVLYVGGEFCPFCAVERWSMIVALSRFGTFSGVEFWQSSATDTNGETPTFTFANATYASNYITFVPVEEFGEGGPSDVRQTLTADQQALVNQYDTCAVTGRGQGIPFIDIANQYAVNCGAQFSLPNQPGSSPNIAGLNWTQIASQLNTQSSPVAQVIDGAANTLITAICKVDGSQPSHVCTQSYATLALDYTPAPAATFRSTHMAVPVRPLVRVGPS